MTVDSGARLLVRTVEELSVRAPAIVAAAARQMKGLELGLTFGDGSQATLRARRSRLTASDEPAAAPDVEVAFDDRALNLLFDLERPPAEELLAGSLDVRGERSQVLAVWRAFGLLSQRASGLRAVQTLWRAYRDRTPDAWGRSDHLTPLHGSRPVPAHDPEGPPESGPVGHPVRGTPDGDGPQQEWRALDWVFDRAPRVDGDGRSRPVVGGTVLPRARSLWDGRQSSPWWGGPGFEDADLRETLAACRQRVREEMESIVPDREPREALYDLVRDYPGRPGKGLRPTLTLAACAAHGGRTEDAVRAAAAIELFHNGFLVHDDIADGSTHRRKHPTLHRAEGVGLAVNAGDALNLLAVDTVLSNLSTLGLARTLALIGEITHMCRETVEGQAVELGWIREGRVPPADEDYFRMSTKKTGWYTCISPCRLGAICAGETDPTRLDAYVEAFRLIGIAFQIQDDLLNLVGETALYGKEPLGDLLEGKRTVMLIHLFREADPDTRRRMEEIIRLDRREKTQEDAREILRAMEEAGSLEYGFDLADRLAHRGIRKFEEDLDFLPDSEAKGVLRQVANYVTTRPL